MCSYFWAEDLNAQKATLVQHLRSLGAKTAKLLKVSTIAAKEGSATAQRLFIPAPAYPDLDDEESLAAAGQGIPSWTRHQDFDFC
jgi:hypothetical protein